MNILTKVSRPTGIITPVIRKMVDGELKEVRRYDTFNNVVTNDAMLGILDNQGTKTVLSRTMAEFRYLRVGTGTAPYTASTEQMGNPVTSVYAGTEDTLGFSLGEIEENGEYFIYCQVGYAFSLGEVVGTFTEIATFSSTLVSPTYKVKSGTLIKDTAGDPVAITVASDEQLIIYYEYRVKVSQEFYDLFQGENSWVYPEITDLFPSPVNVNGVDYAVSSALRLYNYYRIGGDSDLSNSNRNLYFYTFTPTGSYFDKGKVFSVADLGGNGIQLVDNSPNGEVSGIKTIAPNNESMTYDVTVDIYPAAGLDDLAKVECLNATSGGSALTLEFSPAIPIPAGEKLTLSFTLTFDWSGS